MKLHINIYTWRYTWIHTHIYIYIYTWTYTVHEYIHEENHVKRSTFSCCHPCFVFFFLDVGRWTLLQCDIGRSSLFRFQWLLLQIEPIGKEHRSIAPAICTDMQAPQMWIRTNAPNCHVTLCKLVPPHGSTYTSVSLSHSQELWRKVCKKPLYLRAETMVSCNMSLQLKHSQDASSGPHDVGEWHGHWEGVVTPFAGADASKPGDVWKLLIAGGNQVALVLRLKLNIYLLWDKVSISVTYRTII